MASDKALITGGAGLIGSHIVDQLLSRGYAVRILDNLDEQTHPRGRPDWIPADVEFIHGDVRNQSDVESALRGVDVVFHEAAFGGFTTELSTYSDVNATGTVRLFEGIRNTGGQVRKVVVASSQATYGEGTYACAQHGVQYPSMRRTADLERREWDPKCATCDMALQPLPTPEDRPLQAETIYGLTKLATERWSLALGRSLGIPVVALRYAVTFGPRQSIFNPYTGVVSIFSTRLLNDQPVVVYEDGNQSRDFIFVEDVARANVHVMQDSRADGQVFNVGTGRRVTVSELVRALAALYGKPPSVSLNGMFRPQDVRHFQHDPRRLEALGWRATTPLDEALQRYAEWIRTRGAVQEYFSAAFSRLSDLKVVLPSSRPTEAAIAS